MLDVFEKQLELYKKKIEVMEQVIAFYRANASELSTKDVLFAKRVLLVEDNELHQEIAAEILFAAGLLVDFAGNGEQAVKIIEAAPSDCYDFILMDLQMPVKNGFVATEEIRAMEDSKKANIPIIAITANGFEEDKKHAFESGMNGFLTKPISIDILKSVLTDILK